MGFIVYYDTVVPNNNNKTRSGSLLLVDDSERLNVVRCWVLGVGG